jgi:quercetin dioxygenase-like cupin family protein
MKSLSLLPLCLCVAGAVTAAEPMPAGMPADSAMPMHDVVRAASTAWGPAPPVLPAGAQMAVLYGDPGKPGAFAIRLKAPAGYRVPRHWHPTDEQVTLISGDFNLSMGKKDEAMDAALVPGDYANLPAQMQHEASTKNGAVVEIHSEGPFQIHYVDPADDPTAKKD